MAFSSATSAHGRGRLGSASTSSLSSIGTSPATEGGYYSLAQQPYTNQHLQHHPHHHNHLQQQLVEQYNPPIDPQLFGITGDTSLPEASFASSSVITGEVVAGGTASGVYSDTERLPSLGISVSGDEEEAEREGRGLVKTVKLEEVENGHHNQDRQQHCFGTAGMNSTGDGATGILQPWQRGEEGMGMMTGRRQLRSRSTLELSEPDIGVPSETDLEQYNQCRQESASASPEPDKEPTLPPPPSHSLAQVPVKRGRGRPRKHPLPVDAVNQPISPTPNKTVTVAIPAFTTIARSTPAPAAKSTPKETPTETPSTPVKVLSKEGDSTTPATPVPVKRGPGRPKGSGNKRKAFNLKKRTSSGTPGPRTPTQSVSAGTISPDGVVKRGPGRPRKSMLDVVQNAGNEDRRSSGCSVGTPAAEHNNTPGWRRSVRERRSVNNSSLFNRANLAEEDLKAPVMGQGCLRKIRRSVGYPPGRRVHGERGYIGKAELQKIRRAKITAKLQPPINDSEELPDFPPEFGFKVSYFRASSSSQQPPLSSTSSSAATPSSPRPTTANNNSTSLPTPPQPNPKTKTTSPRERKFGYGWARQMRGTNPSHVCIRSLPRQRYFAILKGS
ncbi:hypothetical protein BGX38DRAFT_153 [Terfezia claveryi]|nr:hypothetical protein BGX38DRAFT_153 [Terfezia claveryi]